MDTILSLTEEYLLVPYVYPDPFLKTFPPDSIFRQALGLTLALNLGGYLFYFVAAGASYFLLFDQRLKTHSLYLKNQIRREIGVSCSALWKMSLLTLTFFVLEVRGFSKLHSDPLTISGLLFSVTSFILFTDCLIYWIHRGLHSTHLYRKLHKVHHTWKVPTPFASHAFHPLDGFLQSVPYHIYVFLFPMNKYVYLGMFVLVNFWTVSIHDGVFSVPKLLKAAINGAAHHTDHHLFYNYNYGQFFTLWDRIGGSFKEPSAFTGDSPLSQIIKQNSKIN